MLRVFNRANFTRFHTNPPPMKALFLSLFLAFFVSCLPAPSFAQCRIRIMDVRELTLQADLILRVKVGKVKAVRTPMYGQLATLDVIEVIYGDARIKQVQVWALSNTYCAMDSYAPEQEMLVFLVRDQTLYKTLNLQYGEFSISNGVTVEGWRGDFNNPGLTYSKNFSDVKREVLGYLEDVRKARPPQ